MINLTDVSLRRVDIGDSDRLIKWRNSEYIRSKMINSNIVKSEDHKKWLKNTLNDSSSQWFVVNYNKQTAGVIYITNIINCDKTSTWGMYVDGKYMNSVVGVLMEIVAIDKMVFDLGIRKIWGETLETNKKLLSMHQKFGFDIEGVYKKQIYRDNTYLDVYRIALFSTKWKTIRNDLMRSLGVKE